MKKLSAQEIIDILVKHYSYDSIADQEWLDFEKESELNNFVFIDLENDDNQKKEILNYLELGEVECVSHYGGEGHGDDYYDILYFKSHDIYIRIDGWYTSYSGVSYDDTELYEVKPKEKIITVYESI